MLEIVEKLEEKLASIDKQMAAPGTFSDQKKMIELNRERHRVEEILEA